MMDIKFNFTEVTDNDGYQWKHGGWIGKYTIGNISWRGTRVWFRSPFVKSFDTLASKEKVERCREELLKGETRFPSDCCNLRGDSLESILQELKGEVAKPEKCIYCNGTINNLLKRKADFIDDAIKQELANENFQFDEILIDAEPYNLCNVWLLTHKTDIITELEYVLDRCDDEGVLWIWV